MTKSVNFDDNVIVKVIYNDGNLSEESNEVLKVDTSNLNKNYLPNDDKIALVIKFLSSLDNDLKKISSSDKIIFQIILDEELLYNFFLIIGISSKLKNICTITINYTDINPNLESEMPDYGCFDKTEIYNIESLIYYLSKTKHNLIKFNKDKKIY